MRRQRYAAQWPRLVCFLLAIMCLSKALTVSLGVMLLLIILFYFEMIVVDRVWPWVRRIGLQQLVAPIAISFNGFKLWLVQTQISAAYVETFLNDFPLADRSGGLSIRARAAASAKLPARAMAKCARVEVQRHHLYQWWLRCCLC